MNKNLFFETQLTQNQAALFYLGQEGFLIKYRETYLLIDPYLTDYVDRNCNSGTVQWKRRYPAPIAPEAFDFVDYVFCTHDHFDHADPDSLSAIAKVNKKVKFIAPAPIRDTILSYGVAPDCFIGAKAGELLELNQDCKVLPIPSAHEELHFDRSGNCMELGYKILAGNFSIYHAGDCCIYDGLAESLMNVDVLMVPVNGRSFYKRYHEDIIGNMTAEEAVILAQKTHAGMVVPMHYDLYDVNRINPAQFVDCLFSINPSQRFHMFAPGECYIISK